MKQTAVEYLIKEFSDILGKIQTETFQDLLIVYAMEKAKEIEKQQIIEACYNSQRTDFYVKYYDAEQYYKETFNNK
jgi:hypothetical protein